MDITDLKSSFWGYKKSDVYEYVAQLNDQFSKKMTETICTYDEQIAELQEKIRRLEKGQEDHEA